MMLALLGLLLGFTPAAAADDLPPDASDVDSGVKAKAEYVRLSQELEKLAMRNAWSGVERTFLAIVETGVQPSFNDYVTGAARARSMGDISAARARLMAANALKEDRGVLDSLWEIDSKFGAVYLASDVGAMEFKAEATPFEPVQAKSVEFARTKIEETGVFEGFLPEGTYWFGETEVKVQPRVSAIMVDVRTDDGHRVKKKKKKKKQPVEE